MRSAVVGAGQISRQHLSCLSRLPRVEIAGICDLSPATAESTAERYRIPAWYTDYGRMLAEARPDMVHITTPPTSHFALARLALESGVHVFVEKPATVALEQLLELGRLAEPRGLWLVEDHNLAFNRPIRRIRELIRSGAFGEVVHVDVHYCLSLFGPGNPFCDPNAHLCLSMPGGAIADFLTHLSYLAYVFVGPHRAVRTIWQKRKADTVLPSDEFRALVSAERGTAMLSFSAHSQPDGCWVGVHGTKMRALANLYEGRLVVDEVGRGPKPLVQIRNGLREAWEVGITPFRSIWQKLAGRYAGYEGLHYLIQELYQALERKSAPPVSPAQIEAVNRLVADLTRAENEACAVLVTGAGGFLGRHVVASLLKRGHQVRAPCAGAGGLPDVDRLELFQGDLRDRHSLVGLFDGVEVLVHLAAATSGDDVAQFSSSVAGTESLLAVMAESATRRLVLASSFSVYDYSSSDRVLNEDSALERRLYERDGYPVAKVWQERVVCRAAEKHGWDLIVLRPGFIWGAEHAFPACLGFNVGSVYFAYAPLARPPLTHVENCADCFAHAAEQCGRLQGVFNVVDDYQVRSWRYLGQYIKRGSGRGVRVPFPFAFGLSMAHFARSVSRMLFKDQGRLPGIMTPIRFRARFKPLRFERKRLREVLGWHSVLPFEECLARTFPAGGSNGR